VKSFSLLVVDGWVSVLTVNVVSMGPGVAMVVSGTAVCTTTEMNMHSVNHFKLAISYSSINYCDGYQPDPND
jgi:hypothetical protein